jgi:hypothetical protein
MDLSFFVGVLVGLLVVAPLVKVTVWRMRKRVHRHTLLRESGERLLARRLGRGR